MIFFIITDFHFNGNALIFILEAVYINHGEIVLLTYFA